MNIIKCGILTNQSIKVNIIEYKLKRQPSPEMQIIITLSENKLALAAEEQLILLEKLLPSV